MSFFIEDTLDACTVPTLSEALTHPCDRCCAVQRQDAGLVLTGRQASHVMAQTCAIDFHSPPERTVMSRVAGVSCMILPLNDARAIRIWCGASYGIYLWETLLDIVRDLGGAPVGLDSLHASF